jgi:hypothetical protein
MIWLIETTELKLRRKVQEYAICTYNSVIKSRWIYNGLFAHFSVIEMIIYVGNHNSGIVVMSSDRSIRGSHVGETVHVDRLWNPINGRFW